MVETSYSLLRGKSEAKKKLIDCYQNVVYFIPITTYQLSIIFSKLSICQTSNAEKPKKNNASHTA